MFTKLFYRLTATVVAVLVTTPLVMSQNQASDYQSDYNQEPRSIRIDRYLAAEVWTNHADGEYYVGDNINLKFRVNQDAFVVLYSVDSRGRVNLLFPTSPRDDNFVRGNVTYRLPDDGDDFDLVITGPEGVENIQMIASRERFPVPDWYRNSGIVFDWDDRFDFMDYLNGKYFVRYDGQRFAYDRTAMYVNEWEAAYFRPVYYPHYPGWTIYGNTYIDYPWGSSVYINGIYWGCTPLYIPRLYVGWHTMTIYDPYGYCWESNFHLTRYHTVVFDKTIIQTSPRVQSKYKEVRYAGYQNPVKSGYPKYQEKIGRMKTALKSSGKIVTSSKNKSRSTTYIASSHKKYVRGDVRLSKTSRGYETSASPTVTKKNKRSSYSTGKSSSTSGKGFGNNERSRTSDKQGYSSGSNSRKGSTATGRSYRSGNKRSSGGQEAYRARGKSRSGSSGGYYQKKSGPSRSSGKRSGKGRTVTNSKKSSKSGSGKVIKPSKSGNRSQPAVKSSSKGGFKAKGTKSSGGSGGKNKSSGKSKGSGRR